MESAISLSTEPLASNFFHVSLNKPLHVYRASFLPEVPNPELASQLLHSAERPLTSLIGFHIISSLDVFAAKEVISPISIPAESEGQRFTLSLCYSHHLDMAQLGDQARVCLMLDALCQQIISSLGLKPGTRLPIKCGWYSGAPLLAIDSPICTSTRTLLDELLEYRHQGGNWRKHAKSQLEGKLVMATYGRHRIYAIDEIHFEMNPKKQIAEGDNRSFIDYYRAQYHESITNESQPLVRSADPRSGTPLYLIPELVNIVDGHQAERKSTRFQPESKSQSNRELTTMIVSSSATQALLSHFEVTIDPQHVPVSAGNFSGETVFTAANRLHPIDQQGRFQIRDILTSVILSNWVVVAPSGLDKLVQTVTQALCSRLGQFNEASEKPSLCFYGPNKTLEVAVSDACRDVQFLVILLTRGLRSSYADLKKITTAASVLSQVIYIPIPDKRYASVIEKVALQIQAKLGAQLWALKPVHNFGKFVMVIGISAFSDLANNKVLGLCATVHPNFSKYYSITSPVPTDEETPRAISTMLIEAIQAFKEQSINFPRRIIIFRNGIPDTQISQIRDIEVQPIIEACELVENGYHPELIYTVIAKKTSARFFMDREGKMGNVKPGTLITTEVVPNSGDFYLIAHSASQGIAKPALYRNVYSNCNFQVEDLARLAYKLCHLYFNWTGAVKIPAPCMMAHKVASFVAQYLRQDVSPPLRKFSYYL